MVGSTGSTAQEKSNNPVFTVHNIFVKDLSYESPQAPEIFRDPWKPKLDFDLQMTSRELDEADIYEAILNITVSIKIGETEETSKTAFVAEVQQAGVFTIQGFSADQLTHILETTCPGILFPYAREVVSNVVTKGGFPQLLLPPINFEAMYQKKLADAQTHKTEQKASTEKSEMEVEQTVKK